MKSPILIVICFGYLTGVVKGSFKRWVPNTNYDNGRNWVMGRPPCRNDHVRFPENAPPVFVQKNNTVMELILPMDGELVLGDNVQILFPARPTYSADCTGQEAIFNRTSSKDFFDPENWCETSSVNGPCLVPQPDRLETERIPCVADEVIFPRNSSFFVNLRSGMDLFVQSLRVAGKAYTTTSLYDYLRSREGEQFQTLAGDSPTTITIRAPACDVTGCPCGNDQGQIQQTICQAAEPSCPSTLCQSPLLPLGSCCHVCGAILEMDYGFRFKFKKFESVIERDYRGREGVKIIVSKTSRDQIQVVVYDTEGGSNALSLARSLKKAVDQDMTGKQKLGITDIIVRISGSDAAAHFGEAQGGQMTSSSIAGIIIALLGLLLVVVIVVFCLTDRSRIIRARARIRRLITRSEECKEGVYEMGPQASFQDVGGFENPIYDTPAGLSPLPATKEKREHKSDTPGLHQDPSGVTFVVPSDETGKGSTSFQNPLYTQPTQGQYLDASALDPAVTYNPVYSEEGIELDSRF